MRAALVSAAALWLSAVMIAADSRPGADYFPNVTLTTHNGEKVRFYDDLVKGKTVAIALIYTTCQYACPLETARMAQVQTLLGDRMGRDVFFYSITIDPDHDTPAVLKEYAAKYHAGPGWTFLTGAKADIDLISKKLGLYSEPNPANPDGHIPYLLVGNEATGQWMRNSAVDNPKFIARTIGDWLNSWRNARKEPLKSYAEVTRTTFDRGQYTFTQHCAACHTIGRGDHLGPDLAGVTLTRERSWLTRFITAPEKMNAAGDPIATALRAKFNLVRMPNLDLDDEDVSLILDYIAEQSRLAPAAAPKADPAPASVSPAAAAVDVMPIVDPYLRIQQALHADSLDGVRKSARSIAANAAELGPDAAAIRAAADTFDHAADLAATRVAFGRLSDAVLAYAKQVRARLADDVRTAYCPMARKQWLQKGEKVENPYYGQSMSECGRIIGAVSDSMK